MKKKLKLIIPVIFILLVLTACGNKYEGDFSYEVQDFTFTDQTGEKVSNTDLKGKFWIADFVFTSCETVCPPMTSNMVRLQKQLKEAGLNDVQLASFSVDPKVDTPEKLTDYVTERGAETLDNWHLFTGYDFDTIQKFSVKSFKSPVEKLKNDGEFESDQYMHTVSFFLVSPEGNAIKKYDGRQPASIDKIVEDIQAMK